MWEILHKQVGNDVKYLLIQDSGCEFCCCNRGKCRGRLLKVFHLVVMIGISTGSNVKEKVSCGRNWHQMTLQYFGLCGNDEHGAYLQYQQQE